MNRNKHFIGFLAVLMLASLACGMTDQLTGGDQDMTQVSSLWSDVPPMESMSSASQVEMPAFLKAIARPIMDTMMRGLNDGNPAGHWDWTSFMLTDQTPADVQSFYTPERMAEHGWEPSQGACVPMSETGVLCSFTKTEAGTSIGLMIIAATDEQNQQTSVFFLRAEGVETTPTPG